MIMIIIIIIIIIIISTSKDIVNAINSHKYKINCFKH